MRSDATANHLSAARLAVLLGLLLSPVALAHVYAFDILLPRVVGNTPDDAGVFALQWFDSESGGGMATAQLFVTRAAYGPFGLPDANVVLPVGAAVPLSSVVDFADWDASDAGAGCWQPFAEIDDPIEGRQVSRGEGRISTGGAPALWVTTPAAAQPDDAGRLSLSWELDSSRDSVTAIGWQTADGERGSVVAGLPVSGGTRSATYTIDVARLPARPAWLHLVMSTDAGSCDAWWKGYVSRAEVDAGTEMDAGTMPADGGGEGPRGGCGCESSGGLLGLLALLGTLTRPLSPRRGEGTG